MNKLAICLILSLIPLCAPEATAKSTKPPSQAEVAPQPVQADALEEELAENDAGLDFFSLRSEPEALSTSKLFTQVVLFLFILGIGACSILYLSKKGRLNLMIPNRQKEGGLKVVESKMLGNKQFLMVVEYGNQKMLLGVGPGMINHLCYLNTTLNENEVPREALTQRQEVL